MPGLIDVVSLVDPAAEDVDFLGQLADARLVLDFADATLQFAFAFLLDEFDFDGVAARAVGTIEDVGHLQLHGGLLHLTTLTLSHICFTIL